MSWTPSIGRNHLLARSAARDGFEVTFVERPHDIRAWRRASTRADWWRGLRLRGRSVDERIRVVGQAALLPGHRSAVAQQIHNLALRRALRAIGAGPETVLVATVPWQWPAVAGTPAARRVYDCGDDWGALIPRRAAAFSKLHSRIGREADTVVLVSRDLVGEFGDRRVEIVPNGLEPRLAEASSAAPAERCMVYAGTLSERVDAAFLGRVLARLPDWRLELYGQCRYAGRGDRPGPELEALLEGHGGRARWMGAVERERLAAALDRGEVLVAAHRAAQVRGQSSMKLYDYAARRRPIVTTPGALGPSSFTARAGVIEAAGVDEFAAAVLAAAGSASGRRASGEWLAEHSWDARWSAWREAVLGPSGRP